MYYVMDVGLANGGIILLKGDICDHTALIMWNNLTISFEVISKVHFAVQPNLGKGFVSKCFEKRIQPFFFSNIFPIL